MSEIEKSLELVAYSCLCNSWFCSA